mgnify:CR=1 FL=1
MIKSAKMSMKGWAASTPLCPKKNHINKKMGMGANNASKSNKLLYLYLITILELCVDKRLDTMMTKINN